VQQSLAERAKSYRFALERLIIAAPSPVAVGVERSLGFLQTRIAAATLVPAPNLGTVGPVRQRTVSK
jgi:hypothetical protein